MSLRGMGLRKKIVSIVCTLLVCIAGVLIGAQYVDAKDARDKVQRQFIDKARSIVLTTESTREEMARNWKAGSFTAEQLREWAAKGEKDRILATVPVVTAYRAAMAKAKEGGYEFRTPKIHARNKKNEPDELERAVLQKLEKEGVAEHYEIDLATNSLRYFRPIRLTTECLLCHGDPATSRALWGNDDGLDAVGMKMEGWKEGEVHGAFEVIMPLSQADAEIQAAVYRNVFVIGVLVLAGAALMYWLITCIVVRPVDHLIAGLGETANQVSAAADQVAQTGQLLADNAGQQASSLQETSAALEELAAMTRTNADSAKSANQLSAQARQATDRGDQTMKQLATAMDEISTSSEQIGKIIKVIEEIAFQTNLLALNAAVEAARAGEHGKGFAVVAEEVRSLAQRAAQAAGETTALIEKAVTSVRQGTQVTVDVGQALGSVMADIGQVSTLIEGVARASDEQALGVGQITTAVTQMDRATQQNAASAEHSATASHELSDQAQNLREMLQRLSTLVRGA